MKILTPLSTMISEQFSVIQFKIKCAELWILVIAKQDVKKAYSFIFRLRDKFSKFHNFLEIETPPRFFFQLLDETNFNLKPNLGWWLKNPNPFHCYVILSWSKLSLGEINLVPSVHFSIPCPFLAIFCFRVYKR